MNELKASVRAGVAVLVMFKGIFVILRVPTESMEPTIRAKSLVLAKRFPYLTGCPSPKYGDIVCFQDPDRDRKLIKRVIGLPGDLLEFDGKGQVYRNGILLSEPYLPGSGQTFAPKPRYEVPEGCFFAMGDNRSHSYDSRQKKTPYIPIDFIYASEIASIPAPVVSDIISFLRREK